MRVNVIKAQRSSILRQIRLVLRETFGVSHYVIMKTRALAFTKYFDRDTELGEESLRIDYFHTGTKLLPRNLSRSRSTTSIV